MDNRKWLKRKYPKSFEKVNEMLDDERLYDFKNNRYELGVLIKAVWCVETFYPEGTMIMFKRSNPRDYNHPMHYAVCKCKEDGLTESGYQSLNIWEGDFKEIHN